VCLFLFLPTYTSQAQTKQPHRQQRPQASPASSRASASASFSPSVVDIQKEIERRLEAAKTAIATNDPQQIGAAESKVAAIGLRQMADLRMIEGGYDEASGLYLESFKYEDIPDPHLRLGIAYMRLKKADDALTEADHLIQVNPSDSRGWQLKGNAYATKQDYPHAAEALAHALKLAGDLETAYSLAVCFLAMHEREQAKMVFQDMAHNFGDSGALHVLMGRAYRDAGDDKMAIAEFRRAIELDSKAPHAHYFIAIMLLMKNEWQSTDPEIEKQLAAELQLNPTDYLSNYLLGFAAWQKREYLLARKCLRAAANENPEQPDAWLYLGLAAFEDGDPARAEPWLRRAISLTGTEESRNFYQIRRAYIDLARISSQQGKGEEAEQLFNKARELQQRSLQQSRQRVAQLMSDAGDPGGMGAVVPLAPKEVDRGDQPFQAAAGPQDSSLNPEQKKQAGVQEAYLRTILGSAFNDLGTARARRQEFAEALDAFEAAAKWQPETPRLQRNLGLAAARLEKYSVAAPALSRELAAHPDDGVVRAMLGISEYNLGNFEAAGKAFSGLSEQSADDPRLGLPWAASLAKTGDYNRAAAVLKHIEEQPLSTDMRLLAGQTLGDIGRYDEAIAEFQKAMAEQPGLLKAHYDSGLAYLKSDRPAKAAEEFERELALAPDDADAKYDLAYCLIEQSQTDRAKKLLLEVIAAHPEHANAQYQIGKILLDSGNVAGAIEHLEVAAKLSPDKSFVHYQLQSAYRRASRTSDADRELQIYKSMKEQNRGERPDR
jgi:tetratricopeptide (TPR) repeat protein